MTPPPLAKTGPRGPARAVEPVPLPVVDPQAEADLPEAGPSVFDRLAQASREADTNVCNASRRHPHPLRRTCAGIAPPLWAGGLAGLSLGPGVGSQEWSDSARGAAARALFEEP